MNFEFNALPWRIKFAPGAVREIGDVVELVGAHRALVLTTPEQTVHGSLVETHLGGRFCGAFNAAVMHVPVETVAAAQAAARQFEADCTVAIGGGSTTGLGKALALKDGLPNIAIPTTYAGSEMTNVWGMTEGGRKTTGRDVAVLPDFVVYDPELTLELPAHIAGPSGLNAMAQAVVNVTAVGPKSDHLRLGPRRNSRTRDKPAAGDRGAVRYGEARSEALYGACLAGAALGAGTTGLHHRICHTLGGSYNTPHADTHAIMLAYSVAFNREAVPEGTARVADAMGVDDAAIGIHRLLRQVSDKTSLHDIGIEESMLDGIAQIVTENPINNPRPVTPAGVRDLLARALAGDTPE